MTSIEEEEWVLHTLMEYERGHCIEKALEFQKQPAVARGDNYASEMYRLTIKVVTKAGEVKKKRVILKSIPQSKSVQEFLHSVNLYGKEKEMFLEVLPEMEKLRSSEEPEVEPLSAICYGVFRCDKYLLEDLSDLGYKVAGERKGLDFDHSKIVMKTLGKFHALGAVLIERGWINLCNLNLWAFELSPETGENIFKNNLIALADLIDEKWKGEWLQYSDGLRNTAITLNKQVLDSLKKEKSKFKTLLHGDLWMKNMMFKYGDDEKPIHVRFVDYQLCHYNQVGFDYQYFLWTSVHTDVRPRQADLLVLYYDSLKKNLNKFGYSKECPTYEEILEDSSRAALIGASCGLCFLPFMMCPRDDAPDMNQISEDFAKKADLVFIDKNKDEGEDYKRTVRYNLKEARALGFI